ncbi:hypothetical protein LCGC14_0815570 [marine sediment metagenome]|uniref:Uncharacterized protein n=1 Tax=marine sediment metagenome TaxID=412755 RepID=A0A0F9Q5S7_9ZZZZ
MKEVLITYKKSSRTRIVPQAHWRATLTRMKYEAQEKAVVELLGTMHKSPMTSGPKVYEYERGSSDIRCWKRCSKKAQRGWQRHPKRTRCKRRNRFGYNQQYYPSVRLLTERGLCIYPAISG